MALRLAAISLVDTEPYIPTFSVGSDFTSFAAFAARSAAAAAAAAESAAPVDIEGDSFLGDGGATIGVR